MISLPPIAALNLPDVRFDQPYKDSGYESFNFVKPNYNGDGYNFQSNHSVQLPNQLLTPPQHYSTHNNNITHYDQVKLNSNNHLPNVFQSPPSSLKSSITEINYNIPNQNMNQLDINHVYQHNHQHSQEPILDQLPTPPRMSTPPPEERKLKLRKKRQCTECKLYFLNLATHKSTHLKPTNRPHVCKYCSRGFARPNDLFRHIKCHWKELGNNKGNFNCPFKEGNMCSHSTGVFTRSDTLKNHLRALHYAYPQGTAKQNRSSAKGGSCRQCGEDFETVDAWLSQHVEKKLCSHIRQHAKCE